MAEKDVAAHNGEVDRPAAVLPDGVGAASVAGEDDVRSSVASSPLLLQTEQSREIDAQAEADVARILPQDTNSDSGPVAAAPSAAIASNRDALAEQLESARAQEHILKRLVQQLEDKVARLSEDKEIVEAQYRSLLGKVSQMKATLGERLKQDSEELAEQRQAIEELSSTNAELQQQLQDARDRNDDLERAEVDRLAELGRVREQQASLEADATLKNDELQASREASRTAAMNFETATQEERHLREQLKDRIAELEEQITQQNLVFEELRMSSEADRLALSTMESDALEMRSLHKQALEDRLREIDDLTAGREAALSAMRAEIDRLEAKSAEDDRQMERMRPYEQEVKEKTLLLGKLRHEAVILNEHLTKALRLIRRGATGDSVDRHLLNNILLSFLSLPRQDTKRFEVLKVLSSVLGWSEQQQEMAGLLKPGSSALSQIRSPPSSPSLSRTSAAVQAADYMPQSPGGESMGQLWISFLESQSAAEKQ